MVNSTGRLAGTPDAFRPGPLARTLLASWAGKVLILKGLKEKVWGVDLFSGKLSFHEGIYVDFLFSFMNKFQHHWPARDLLLGVLHTHRVRAVVGWSVVDCVRTLTVVSDADRLTHTWRASGHKNLPQKETVHWWFVAARPHRVTYSLICGIRTLNVTLSHSGNFSPHIRQWDEFWKNFTVWSKTFKFNISTGYSGSIDCIRLKVI